MRTVVTTCEIGWPYLGDFMKLAKRFYPKEIQGEAHVDIAKPGEAKSDQLIRLLNSFDDEYFILLEDDFWLVEPVSFELLDQICEFCIAYSVDRFSLQSKNAHSYSDWTPTQLEISGCEVYKTNPNVVVPFSLEASVWKRDFLSAPLSANLNDAQIEVRVSKYIRGLNLQFNICALDQTVINYIDAMRDGERVLTLHENPLRLTGPQLARHGDGEELIL